MKTNFKKITIVILIIFLNISCSKNDEEIIVKDCEKNDYGIVTINYSSNSVKHSIIITPNGSNTFREKISATGVVKDTLHLKTGSYSLSISSLNASNQVIDQLPTLSATTTKCSERIIDANL